MSLETLPCAGLPVDKSKHQWIILFRRLIYFLALPIPMMLAGAGLTALSNCDQAHKHCYLFGVRVLDVGQIATVLIQAGPLILITIWPIMFLAVIMALLWASPSA